MADVLLLIDPTEFSWRDTEAAPSLHGVKEAGYQMRIAASSRDLAAEKPLLWDSGKVSGDATPSFTIPTKCDGMLIRLPHDILR